MIGAHPQSEAVRGDLPLKPMQQSGGRRWPVKVQRVRTPLGLGPSILVADLPRFIVDSARNGRPAPSTEKRQYSVKRPAWLTAKHRA